MRKGIILLLLVRNPEIYLKDDLQTIIKSGGGPADAMRALAAPVEPKDYVEPLKSVTSARRVPVSVYNKIRRTASRDALGCATIHQLIIRTQEGPKST